MLRRPSFNPLAGDTRSFTLHYIDGEEQVEEYFEDILVAQERARELYRSGIPRDFWISTTTTQITIFEPRTAREMAVEQLARNKREALRRREEIDKCPTEELAIDSGLFG
jgi:hypothetical protein